jgi:hypothetical protein
MSFLENWRLVRIYVLRDLAMNANHRWHLYGKEMMKIRIREGVEQICSSEYILTIDGDVIIIYDMIYGVKHRRILKFD